MELATFILHALISVTFLRKVYENPIVLCMILANTLLEAWREKLGCISMKYDYIIIFLIQCVN